MGLAAGRKLGPYEIQSALGAGGMGEVYRARDTRLDREVAIKVLPAEVSSDPSLRQRLEREAKAVSKLSHPHICTLFDIGHQDGVDFLVMELIQGETLEQRLTRGPLPLEQTLRFAAETADALAKAHKLGVVHRDLKPSNIMLTKSGAKLMDFGLAKECAPAALMEASTVEQRKLTAEGAIVGTFQYMAPEQLEGRETDARTDIFALGEVIYEMATGKLPFAGRSRASLIAAILSAEPPSMAALQPMTPAALERVVKRCLAKDPDERWQNASDLASEIAWIAEAQSQAAIARGVESAGKWPRSAFAAIAALLLLTVIGGWALWKANRKLPTSMYFQAGVPFAATDLAVSQDGKMVAMVAYSNQAKSYVLWTHELGSHKAAWLEGTQGATFPFWSPDRKYIGFFADGKLKRVEASGGQPQVIADAPNGRGGTWNRDGVIVFAPDAPGGLYRVTASGGAPVQVTKPDLSRKESSNRWPVFLPDGKHFLYLAANFTGGLEAHTIFVGSLDSSQKHEVINSKCNAAYADPGYLLYMRDNALVAQPFDTRRFTLTGEPLTLTDEVLFYPQIYRAVFGAANGGVLVTQTGKGVSLSQLTWFDRTGKPVGNIGPVGSYHNVRLSPDGSRVAEDQTDPDGQNIDVWILNVNGDGTRRLTFDPALEQTGIWTPDGKNVLYMWTRTTGNHLFLKKADGSGSGEEIAALEGVLIVPWDWSNDGKFVLFRRDKELWYFTWPGRVMKSFVKTSGAVRNGQFSPDGRWVAYASSETGSMEIYVTPFPSAETKWQVSTRGGEEPRWRRDGKELFYVSPDGKMMSVPVKTGDSFEAGSPVMLFQTERRKPVAAQDVFSYDVSAEGKRFLVITRVDEANAQPPSVFLNWASQMQK